MRKVIFVDGTRLSNKYKNMLLFFVTQGLEKHIYPIAFYIVDKENVVSWEFFFRKL